ncbi:MAG: DNA repair protein RadC [Mollicutes bacterium]|nr:DNA repair protein RadC [Mollicutes bacterium]
MLLKEMPLDERPREKALKYGIENLSNAELIAIIFRTGKQNENAVNVALNLLKEISSIKDLQNLSISELTKISGIGLTKALMLLSAVELGYRIMNDNSEKLTFPTSKSVYEYMKPKFSKLKEEQLYAIYLDVKGNHIETKMLTKGNVSSTIIDGKLIFKWAYKLSAAAIILVHNHPSGDPTPSIYDIKYTEVVLKQAKLTEFMIIDHIIIGEGYFSMKKECKIFKMF